MTSSKGAEEYLNDPRTACEVCGVPKDDVEPRAHPFVVEGIWDWAPEWKMCLDCLRFLQDEV